MGFHVCFLFTRLWWEFGHMQMDYNELGGFVCANQLLSSYVFSGRMKI